MLVKFLDGTQKEIADLRNANLGGAKYLSQQVIAGAGELIGYKKTREGVITLRIPKAAKRLNAIGSRKCRAEYAYVVKMPKGARLAHSKHDESFTYKAKQKIVPDSFDDDIRVECSHGVHFFITEEEAIDY